MAISSVGIGSGVLTSDLIDKLASAEREPTELRLDVKTEKAETQLSDFGRIKSAVSDLRLSARTLATADAFGAAVGESTSDAVALTAGSAAKPGSYQIEVSKLATAQSLASASFTDKDTTPVGAGTLQIQVGDKLTNVTIDSSSNTLDGLAKAINDSNSGANASVLFNGTGYQLVIASKETGLANAVTITATDSDGNSADTAGLSQFNSNATNPNMTETMPGQDAEFRVNGLALTRPTNSFDDVIPGSTLKLTDVTTAPATVTIRADSEKATERMQDFVDKYNALKEIINEVTAFNASSGEKGSLLGNSAVRSIAADMRSVIGNMVPGLEKANVRSLAEIGVSTNATTGLLEFNSSKFSEKLTAYPEDVAGLFSEQGRTTDASVTYSGGSINTKVGSYGINVTQMATKGAYTGASPLAASTVIDADNGVFSISVDGKNSSEITLTAGTYTQAEMISEIQKQLDANAGLQSAGVAAKASLGPGGELLLSSTVYGKTSNVSIMSTGVNTAASLGLSVGAGVAGLDVEGTINGQKATGTGQYLRSDEGDSSGLRVQITGGTIGDRGQVSYIEGVGDQMVDRINNMLSARGSLSVAIEGFNTEIGQIKEDRQKLDLRIESLTARLVKQFSAADSLVSRLNNTGDFLTAQLKAMAPGAND
ncbi:flagellar filament capping protein FliD [Allohahella marinimesophila]|uniref:Flagellar hook-associated protein 2 n=1 Tax=Allohahella marinimesophila TaxID=1054972 RepID=A0ABP7NU87_9GAMM